MGIFDYLTMENNYEDRAIANFEKDKLTVDTCAVTDSTEPFETGIKHPAYNSGAWVIVELYKTKELAQKGHDKWVKIMTTEKLPSELKEISTSEISQFAKAVGCEVNFKKNQ